MDIQSYDGFTETQAQSIKSLVRRALRLYDPRGPAIEKRQCSRFYEFVQSMMSVVFSGYWNVISGTSCFCILASKRSICLRLNDEKFSLILFSNESM